MDILALERSVKIVSTSARIGGVGIKSAFGFQNG
jgi:hypothetical protein